VGLLTGLITLPIAPVRGLVWVAERLYDEAYRQTLSPEAARRQLAVALRDLEAGRITESEYDELEEWLLPLIQNPYPPALQPRGMRASSGQPAGPHRSGQEA
jgi:hypothetical protein